MMDIVYVAATLVFFALMLLYVLGCDRLGRAAEAERAGGELP